MIKCPTCGKDTMEVTIVVKDDSGKYKYIMTDIIACVCQTCSIIGFIRVTKQSDQSTVSLSDLIENGDFIEVNEYTAYNIYGLVKNINYES